MSWLKRKKQEFVKWGIGYALTDEEKYILARALDDRLDVLDRVRTQEKWADRDGVRQEKSDTLKLIRQMNLGTTLWK